MPLDSAFTRALDPAVDASIDSCIDSSIDSERRKRRSSDPLIALHYQLTVARTESELEAIVVADDAGLVVAGAGSWAACEELAAYAPLLEADPVDLSSQVSSRVVDLRREVDVLRVDVGGTSVIVCALGGTERRVSLARAVAGARRILRAA